MYSFLDPRMFNASEVVGHHGIVVVGYRLEGGKKQTQNMCDANSCEQDEAIILLLQNSWDNKTFLEVSLEYLKRAGAKLLWVTANKSTITDDYPLLKGVYFETFPS